MHSESKYAFWNFHPKNFWVNKRLYVLRFERVFRKFDASPRERPFVSHQDNDPSGGLRSTAWGGGGLGNTLVPHIRAYLSNDAPRYLSLQKIRSKPAGSKLQNVAGTTLSCILYCLRAGFILWNWVSTKLCANDMMVYYLENTVLAIKTMRHTLTTPTLKRQYEVPNLKKSYCGRVDQLHSECEMANFD